MLRHYFLTSLRLANRNKQQAVLRTMGLAFALFFLLVAALYVYWQLSFDRFHDRAAHIYRVNGIRDEGGQFKRYAVVPPGLGPSLQTNLTGVESVARISLPGRQQVKYQDKVLRPNGFVEADPAIFDVFTLTFVHGDARALDQPASLVLTASLSAQLFGEENPLGKPVVFVERFNRVLTVTAVIADLPANSHMDFKAVTGRYDLLDSAEQRDAETWHPGAASTLYVRLQPGTDPDDFAERINPLLIQNMPRREDGGEQNFRVFLQPVTSIYFDAPLTMEFSRKGNRVYLYGFLFLTFFLVLIAAVGYINLSLAELGARMRQMGVRKALGASRRQMVMQTAVDGVLYSGTAFAVALVALVALFPEICRQLEPNLTLTLLTNVSLIAPLAAVFLVIVALLSFAPSLAVTRNAASTDMRGELAGGKSGNRLLLPQVTLALMCLAVTWVMSRQISFLQNTDLGYERHRVVALLMPDRYPVEKAPALKNRISELPGVSHASYSYYMITGSQYQKGGYRVEMDGVMKPLMVNESFIDHDFILTMEISLLMGRNFDPGNPADVHSSFLVNEAAVRAFGWTDAIGKRISVGQGEEPGKWQGSVIGVTTDFNIRPLRERIEPLIMRLPFDDWPGYWLNVRVSGSMEETIKEIRTVFGEVLPGYVADYRMLEDVYDRQYQQDAKAFTAIRFGTVMIASIAIIGIFSLSMYLSRRRLREFGIRKVLGANSGQIMRLHLGQFFRIAVVASILALPLSAWLMSRWLEGFAYRTPVGIFPYLMVSVAGLLVLLGAAGCAALAAARVNPLETIRRT